MSRQQSGKGKKNAETSLSKDVEDVRQISVLGTYSEAEMIGRLKVLAQDPCRLQFARDNIRPLWNQILRFRKLMVLEESKIPWRKRKLEQFVKDKLRAPSSTSPPDHQHITKVSRRQSSHASSMSCLVNSFDSTQGHEEKIIFNSQTSCSLLTFDDSLPEKQVSTECSVLDDMLVWTCPGKDKSPSVDTDESVNGSNPQTPAHITPNETQPVDISEAIHCLRSGAKKRSLEPQRRSTRSQNFSSEGKKIIPVGPHFQVDVPEWCSLVDRSVYKTNSENSKWLGTRVWPAETGNTTATTRTIGKGRPGSCSCVSPGNADCIRRHIRERRPALQHDLGPAFFIWKFDEMGEQVSKLWTLREQQTFESIMRPVSNGKDFLARALKCISKKNRKDIVSYYFNVYILKRMSLQTRSPSVVKRVDTDDEEEEDDDNSKKGKGSKKGVCSNSKDVKARFLRRV